MPSKITLLFPIFATFCRDFHGGLKDGTFKKWRRQRYGRTPAGPSQHQPLKCHVVYRSIWLEVEWTVEIHVENSTEF